MPQYDTKFPSGNGGPKEEITTEIAADIRSGLGAESLTSISKTYPPPTAEAATQGNLYIQNVGSNTETGTPDINDHVFRSNGILVLSRNVIADGTAITKYRVEKAGTAALMACGAEGVQFGTVTTSAAGVAVPAWATTWQMAIDHRDGRIRMRQGLAIGEVFNWNAWRSTEVFWCRGTAGGDVGEFVRGSSASTLTGTVRITHETSALAGTIADGFGGTLGFSMRGTAGTGLSHTDLAAIRGVRQTNNTSGAITLETRNSGSFGERVRITPAGLIALGGFPSASLPALKQVTDTIQVRLSDDSGYGGLACRTTTNGINNETVANTAWVNNSKSYTVSVAKSASIAISDTAASIHVTGSGNQVVTAFTGGIVGRTYTLAHVGTDSLTLQNGANLVTQTGANIVLAANQVCSVHVISSGVYSVW